MKKSLLLLVVCLATGLFARWEVTELGADPTNYFSRSIIKLSPDQKYLASTGFIHELVKVNDQTDLLIKNLTDNSEIIVANNIEASAGLSWFKNSKELLYGNSDGYFYKVNVETQATERVCAASIAHISFDGEKLLYSKDRQKIIIRNLTNCLEDTIQVYSDTSSYFGDFRLPTNGNNFVCTTTNSDLRYINLNTLETKLITNEIIFSGSQGESLDGYKIWSYQIYEEDSALQVIYGNKVFPNAPGVSVVYDSLFQYNSGTGQSVLLTSSNSPHQGPWFFADLLLFPGQHKILYQEAYISHPAPSCLIIYNKDNDLATDIVHENFINGYMPYAWSGVGGKMALAIADSNTFYFSVKFEYTSPSRLYKCSKTTGIDVNQVPNGFGVTAYPNPFNNSTVINYTMPIASNINLAIYNAKGELVSQLYQGTQPAGEHRATFNATGLNSGVYFVRLSGEKMNVNRKVLLIK